MSGGSESLTVDLAGQGFLPAEGVDDTQSPLGGERSSEQLESISQAQPEPPVATRSDSAPRPREIGGPKGPEPTRYGDWEKGGRCIDF